MLRRGLASLRLAQFAPLRPLRPHLPALATLLPRTAQRAYEPAPVPPPTQAEGVAALLRLPTAIGPLACNVARDNFGARKKAKRWGRGIGSGRGRTAGRGMKGSKARSGHRSFVGFEGGAAPLHRKTPKRGFVRSNQREFKALNLDVLQDAVRAGRIVPPANGAPITARDLHDAGLVGLRRRHAGVKLLARGKGGFDVKLNIEVQEATRRAIEAVEAAGGSLTTVYYSPLTLHAHLKPQRFAKKKVLLPRPALPRGKLMLKYLDPDRRGYLHGVQPGDVIRPHEQPPHVRVPAEKRGDAWAAAVADTPNPFDRPHRKSGVPRTRKPRYEEEPPE